MRLLNVETMKLETFVDEMTTPPYTILSHCWGEDEVSFQDFQEGNCHHLKGFQKIESCCRRTQLEQYAYTWIDTCCINKDSSAELSEAINSMFRWYEEAAICYVYMEDVKWDWSDDTWFDESTEETVLDTPADSAGTASMSRRSHVSFHSVVLRGTHSSELPAIRGKQTAALITDRYPNSCKILQVLPANEYQGLNGIRALSCRPDSPNTIQFRSSRWFTRGWTLQELIAPAHVVFFDHAWRDIGSKITLSNLIFDITGIDKLVLCHGFLSDSRPYWNRAMGRGTLRETLRKFSVATRMYWASRRSTSRVEDIAYCLLGLFDINMPLIYGEGARAFYRLQLEIMQEDPDPSILLFRRPAEFGTDLLAPSPAAFSPEFSEPRYSEDIATKKNAKLCLDPTKTSVSVEALTIDIESLIGPSSPVHYTIPMKASSSARTTSKCMQLYIESQYCANDATVAILTMTRGEALGLLLRPNYPNPSPTTPWFRKCRHTFRFEYDVDTWHALKSRTFTMQLRKPMPPPPRLERLLISRSYRILTMLHEDYHMPMFMDPLISYSLLGSSGREPPPYIFIFRSKNPDTHPPFAIAVFSVIGRIKCFTLPFNPSTDTFPRAELNHFCTLMKSTQGTPESSLLYTDTRQLLVSASTRPSPDSQGLLLVTMERKWPQTHEYAVVKYDSGDLPYWGSLEREGWNSYQRQRQMVMQGKGGFAAPHIPPITFTS